MDLLLFMDAKWFVRLFSSCLVCQPMSDNKKMSIPHTQNTQCQPDKNFTKKKEKGKGKDFFIAVVHCHVLLPVNNKS